MKKLWINLYSATPMLDVDCAGATNVLTGRYTYATEEDAKAQAQNVPYQGLSVLCTVSIDVPYAVLGIAETPTESVPRFSKGLDAFANPRMFGAYPHTVGDLLKERVGGY